MGLHIHPDYQEIVQFCQTWRIERFEFFGSVLREDFSPDSDVDVLVSFSSDAEWGIWDHLKMEEQLSEMLSRKVDLVSRRAVERSKNWIRREQILSNTEPYYAVG
ncbi:MAG: nucleotidyltransferase domain-containing protein [Candidatus Omnitrophica bacterium]|nr:nucleotidyltransferase domain-containing protein [Candidatus Omnitrophota bacterium]